MSWRGYSLIDMGNLPLNELAQAAAKGVRAEIGKQSGNQPQEITQVRQSFDGQMIILESLTDNVITKADVVPLIAELIAAEEPAVNANMDFQTFPPDATLETTWEESQNSCLTHLALPESKLLWEPEEV